MDIKLKLLKELGLTKETALTKDEVADYLKNKKNQGISSNIRVDSTNDTVKYFKIYNDFSDEEIEKISWLKITKAIVDIGNFFKLLYVLIIIGIILNVILGLIFLINLLSMPTY